MKKIFVLFISFLFCSTLHSQTNKGHYFIGMSTTLSSIGTGPEMFGIGFSSTRVKVGSEKGDPNKTFGVNLVPRVGYFVKDNLALGIDANLSYHSFEAESSGETQTSFFSGLGCFSRYYIPVSNFYTIIEVDAGLGISSVNYEGPFNSEYIDSRSFFYNLGTGIGLAVPLGDKATIDLIAGYDFIRESPNETYYGEKIKSTIHSLGFELGFVVVLGAKD